MRFRHLSLSLLTACATLVSAPVFAANFSINPTRIELNARQSVDTVTLTSVEDRETSFEVSLLKWDQDATGKWIEVPSRDLVVYPALLKIQPNGKGIVRVGAKDKRIVAPEVEGTYRLIVQELAGGPNPEGSAVRLLTKISLPVFIKPATERPGVELSVTGTSSDLEYQLKNTGNVHVAPQQLNVTFLDAAGTALGDVTKVPTNTDYALPGATVKVKQPWPANCSAVKSVSVKFANNTEIKAPVSGSCGK